MAGYNKSYPSAEDQPTLKDVAHLITSGAVSRIVCLSGAGISTDAGIPDFRSPETGLYANLAQYDLPYPEAIFDIEYFPSNPEPFYTLAKEIYPGNFLPTLTHYFIALLHKKGLLQRCFTQNIDTLERIAGLPEDKIVEAHGSFATARCLVCRTEMSSLDLKEKVDKGEVVRCGKEACKNNKRALIKPDITFFGEALPKRFWEQISPDMSQCDLLLVMGTSLQVMPFASLIDEVSDSCPRVLINLETVGEIDEHFATGGGMLGFKFRETGFDFKGITTGGPKYTRDIKWIGKSDRGIFELAELCGWKDELLDLYTKSRKELSQRWGLVEHELSGPSIAELIGESLKEHDVKGKQTEETEEHEEEEKEKQNKEGLKETMEKQKVQENKEVKEEEVPVQEEHDNDVKEITDELERVKVTTDHK